MPQLKLRLTLDKRLTFGQMRRRRRKLLRRLEKRIALRKALEEGAKG